VCGAKYAGEIPPPFEDDKVKYRLGDPDHYQARHCLVVGAGNSAVEAALDLTAHRSADGAKIVGWRDNTVTLVIRSDFKSDLRLSNKMLVYECIDEGKIKAYFGATVKEIMETEVALMDARDRDPRTAKELARVENDYVFALIGGDKPTKFLESIGVKIG
jgi:thioredoxin reductase